jgi:hypothetical protein
MRIYSLFLMLMLWGGLAAQAQQAADSGAAHRIVFQLTTADTVAHKAFIRQLDNIYTLAPKAQIEVVCHGPGLDMLLKSSSTVSKGIARTSARGVQFVACEFTLKQRSLGREALLPEVGTVPGAIIEIVTKQAEGWSYIKSGF